MRASDYLRLAFSNLWQQRLRSALTVFAIVIGATSMVLMLSLVTGLKGFFLDQFNKNGQMRQVVVTQATDLNYFQAQRGGGANESGTKLTDKIYDDLAKQSHIEGVARTAGVYVLDAILFNGETISVRGPQAYEPNGVIRHEPVAGRDLAANDGEGVVTLTPAYADKMGYKGKYDALVGKTITLRTNKNFTGQGAALAAPGSQAQAEPTLLQAKVVGVVSSTSNEYSVYFPLNWARQLLQQRTYQGSAKNPKLVTKSILAEQGYQSIVVSVDDTKHVKDVAAAIKAKGLGAATAESFIDQQMAVFNIVSLVLAGIGGISLLVAAVGVVNTMLMAIMERTREIGVMRAVGARRVYIRRVFTLEAAILGGFGGLIGLAIGYGLIGLMNPYINEQLAANGIVASNIITMPAWLVAMVMLVTVGIGMLAGLYPAHRAARMKPVDALRYE
jgi:putative ABC transport system permease protein